MKIIYQIFRNKYNFSKHLFEKTEEVEKYIELLKSADPFNDYTYKEMALFSTYDSFLENNPHQYECLLTDAISNINHKKYPIYLKNKTTSKVQKTNIPLDIVIKIIDAIKNKTIKKGYIHYDGKNQFIISKRDYSKLLEIQIKSMQELNFYNKELELLNKKALSSLINSEKEQEK